MMIRRSISSSLLYRLAFLFFVTSVSADEEECTTTIAHSFTCSTTSLCDDSSAFSSSTYLCYRARSCFIGLCTTTDWQSSQGLASSVCERTVSDAALADSICADGWDSSWWLTSYMEVADCTDTSQVYLDCTETAGDVSSSTAASLGFSALGATALVAYLIRRRRQLGGQPKLVLSSIPEEKTPPVMGMMELTGRSQSRYEAMA